MHEMWYLPYICITQSGLVLLQSTAAAFVHAMLLCFMDVPHPSYGFFFFLLQADITNRDGCGEILLTCSRGLKKKKRKLWWKVEESLGTFSDTSKKRTVCSLKALEQSLSTHCFIWHMYLSESMAAIEGVFSYIWLYTRMNSRSHYWLVC